MELIIKLPSWVYESVKNGTFDAKRSPYDLEYVLKYGHPLPAKHGRLIDGDLLLNEMENGIKSGLCYEGYEEYQHINDMDDCLECVKYSDTIIPADKEDCEGE